MKATFRLPEQLLEELRQLSEHEGRSLNATAIDALWRGLGRKVTDQDVSAALGSFVARRATAAYQPEEVAQEVAALGPIARGLSEALDWTRDEQ